ncbi:hypothetical protein SEA_COLUCCI_16 [Arthrobacter phage Colucci]|uniref:Uncharacterized protein n=1 Tax=Arthrobacter phage Colucci TaxID=2015834 RepID=A0A286N2T0_9CAUD|nr:hypothetical protein FDI27_gp016 [Arthrobacter phage Colucci]ASX98687.1 hypothetical protein SEA_COLUCCI_16 [Arthrobacter phage Colucci]
MSEKVRVHNPNPFEVVIDLEGHSLDGHSATDVSRDTLTDHLIDTGQLLIMHPAPAEPSTPVLVTPAVVESKSRRRNNNTEAPGNGSETGEN